MAGGTMEVTRACLEEIERLENVVVKDLDTNPTTHKERLVQQHRVKTVVDRIQNATTRVMDIMDDRDGSRREELAAMSGKDVFNNFYSRLKDIRDYHRKFPDQSDLVYKEDGTVMGLEDQILQEEPIPEFTGEEGMGRWVDMHELYNRFVNLKMLDGEPMEYLSFIDQVRALEDLSETRLHMRAYRDWVQEVLSYLETFHKRVQPLQDLDTIMVKVTDDFNAKYEADSKAEQPMKCAALDNVDSAEECQALGMDKLKTELTKLGLKCGGTLEQRAQRLFSIKGKTASEVDQSIFAGTGKGKKGKKIDAAAAKPAEDTSKETKLIEVKITKLCEMLGDQLDQTKSNIEKKQSRTFEELQEELTAMETEAIDEEDEEEDDDAPIYNPLNLPLGWDGKPIPFWLYKLHGLNIEYVCEICGNYTYWGPRAFDRHFQEWRHAHGMRCLGIPNSREFHGITKIQDAIDLWLKIKKRNKDTHFNENDEEFEDSAGNVMSKRTYEDLKKQGLLGDF
jgi:splicing factor 3A subunit 3